MGDFDFAPAPGGGFPPIISAPEAEESPATTETRQRAEYGSDMIFVPGLYYRGTTSADPTAASLAMTESEIKAAPFQTHRLITIDRIAITVATAGSAGSVIRLGIYHDKTLQERHATNRPGQLLLDAGTVDSTSTGEKIITIAATTLRPGLYWLVAVGQGAPVTRPIIDAVVGETRMGSPAGGLANIQSRNHAISVVDDVTGALPAIDTHEWAYNQTGTPNVLIRILRLGP